MIHTDNPVSSFAGFFRTSLSKRNFKEKYNMNANRMTGFNRDRNKAPRREPIAASGKISFTSLQRMSFQNVPTTMSPFTKKYELVIPVATISPTPVHVSTLLTKNPPPDVMIGAKNEYTTYVNA